MSRFARTTLGHGIFSQGSVRCHEGEPVARESVGVICARGHPARLSPTGAGVSTVGDPARHPF